MGLFDGLPLGGDGFKEQQPCQQYLNQRQMQRLQQQAMEQYGAAVRQLELQRSYCEGRKAIDAEYSIIPEEERATVKGEKLLADLRRQLKQEPECPPS